ncbi:peptidyl-prolyl cis-trans isomerase SurA [Ulvibacter sp. MAR_2010_11]|uniref:peptidylprolyl isomerase n=1 Tax=Ulvibacter sp. MAR_2010_11 TaxID=1250229 RepID=UPI000C2C0412|nr:peptidylprolyl isomerase [Ulvibacter sp. MAR_2010_11]PKA82063.1 peptidyl-prolyl cis-trans isomerase SurA [Ulvibacter sp. MAR_2010_11]
MYKNLSFLFFGFLFTISAIAQHKKDILLTVNDKPVYTSEFKRVYKKNLDLVKDESQKNVESYLDLFIDYKLKIAEAYAQKLHKDATYKKEFSQYEEQLSRNYLFEDKVTEDLAREAYERGLEEIDASHILVLSGYDDLPQDTLKAYNKIKRIRDRALKGEDFTALAKETSEEPSANDRGGKLGYFSVFYLVYPFETEAYKTPVGEISDIVRTQFGYHIIKVHDRRKRAPHISVSHIMISDKPDSTGTFDPEERINEIYALIQQGESFESLAKQYSDDKATGKVGGRLPKFTKGDLRTIEFEEAAYQLTKPGELSKPIKSSFGWHIIRMEEIHPMQTYVEQMETLLRRVQDPARSKVVTNKVNKKIKEKYRFTQKGDFKTFFMGYLGDEVLQRKWKMDTLTSAQDKVIFTIGDRELNYSDFANYISERQLKADVYKTKEGLISGIYDEFETLELKNYFKYRLEFESEEYAAVVSEYRDGLLIFEVMNKNVWNKAKNDTIGLMKYYNTRKDQYMWKDRVDAVVVSTSSNTIAKQVRALLTEGKTGEEIKQQFNTDASVNVIVSDGIFEIGQNVLPENFEAVKGISPVYEVDQSFKIINVRKLIPPSEKTFEEVRGKVLSDYQNYLEKTWMQELHEKHKVEVNKKELKKVIKELNS